MRLINLTPHAISLANEAGENIQTIPASGAVARVSMTVRDTGHRVAGVPVVFQKTGKIEGLPVPGGYCLYIVSSIVLSALEQLPSCERRTDVLAPDTGPGSVVRNEAGQIVAVRRFIGSEMLGTKKSTRLGSQEIEGGLK